MAENLLDKVVSYFFMFSCAKKNVAASARVRKKIKIGHHSNLNTKSKKQ